MAVQSTDGVSGFVRGRIRPDSQMSDPDLGGRKGAFDHKESVFRIVTKVEKWGMRARGSGPIFRKQEENITKVLKTQKHALFQKILINTRKIEAGKTHKIK